MGSKSPHGLFNLPPLVIMARHLSGYSPPFTGIRPEQAMGWQWDGCPLGLEMVVKDKPIEFHVHVAAY